MKIGPGMVYFYSGTPASGCVRGEVLGLQFLPESLGMAYHSKVYRALYCDSPLNLLYRTDLAGARLAWR